jgi:hypothetical protein
MHHPAVDEGDTGEEDHPYRECTPEERGDPGSEQPPARGQHEDSAQDTEHESGCDGHVNRAPPRGLAQYRRPLLEAPAGHRMKDQANDDQQ